MKLGHEVVVGPHGVGIYGRIPAEAWEVLVATGTVDELVEYVGRVRVARLKRLIRRANRYLRRRGLPDVVPLTAEEREAIARGGDPPCGSLVVQLPG